MQILWSERAYERRQAIEDYILYSFGFVAYSEYLEAVEEWKKAVKENPNIGKEEPLLMGLRKKYRSFVIADLTKCIYYVENDCIMIADWWNTRCSTTNLKSELS